MKKSNYTAILSALLLASCTSVFEKMDRGTPTGDHYVYHLGQIGGQVVARSSMGTETTADNVKSFGDFITMLVAKFGFSAQTKTIAAQETTKRFEAGQITLREKQQLDAAVLQSQSANELTAKLAELQ